MRKKNKLLTIRISEQDRKTLKKKAEYVGRSMASYLLWAAGIYEDEKGIVRIKEESR